MKTILSTLLLCFALSNISAQEWSPDVYKYGTQYPGYIITQTGNKIEGFIKYTNREDLQTRIEFYTEKGNKKTRTKYKAEDLKEYKMADKVYHVIHYSGGLLKKPLRGVLWVGEGCISKYMWYAKHEDALTMRRGANETLEEFQDRYYPATEVFLKKGDEYPVTMTYFGLGYAKKLSEYVSDYPELAKKVADKEKGYGILGFYRTFEEYNEWCANK